MPISSDAVLCTYQKQLYDFDITYAVFFGVEEWRSPSLRVTLQVYQSGAHDRAGVFGNYI